MNKLEKIKKEVIDLHKIGKNKDMKKWLLEGHVLVVANYSEKIAKKVGADQEVSILASLFHDIARCWEVYDDPQLMDESLDKARELMKKHDYPDGKIEEVIEAIVLHSCHRDPPKTEEGKVMATADALAHLMTDFYLVLAFNKEWFFGEKTLGSYKTWVLKKIERDFNKKIFYKEYKDMARKRYESIKEVFSS